jgi:hypothetical protein
VCLCLRVSSDLNPNTGQPFSASQRIKTADNFVFHCAAYPSRIVLPVLFHSTAVDDDND